MKESIVAYIWKHRLAGSLFRTVAGEPVRVEHPGVQNLNAGPDFLNARIRIADTLWAGNVEVHWRASSWEEHGHGLDEKYQNVILHLVMVNDREARTKSGRAIPCIDLSSYVADGILERYGHLMEAERKISCAPYLSAMTWPPLSPWLGRLALERMDKKSGLILSGLEQGPEEWEHAFFKGLFRAFGLPANEHAFESLAERWLQVPSYRTLGAGEQEALLFYLSGLASTSPLAYPQQLMAHGRELAAGIPPGSPALWSFLRMRPASFPTIRLALLASLLPSICDIPLLARPGPSASDWLDLLRARAAGYWDDHFTFGSVSPRNWPKSIGTQLRTSLIANAISPFYTAYGKYSDDHSFIRKAMALLDASAPENNRITRQWQALRLHKPSGTESQGLLELFHSYCTPRRCLECRIGYLVLRSD